MSGTLELWVVYDHPSDFPGVFMARKWEPEGATEDIVEADDLAGVRKLILARAPCAVRMARSKFDDAKIVETWL